MIRIFLVCVLTLLMGEILAQNKLQRITSIKKNFHYQEVDFEDIMRRYLHKEKSDPLEGMYSVSCLITKTYKHILTGEEITKTVKRRDNYARVAVLRDWPGSKREFIEISLSFRDSKRYPIVGDFNGLSNGQGYIYTHIEPNKKEISFSMIPESDELIEGVFSEIRGRKTITYHLSYLKIFPKKDAVVFSD